MEQLSAFRHLKKSVTPPVTLFLLTKQPPFYKKLHLCAKLKVQNLLPFRRVTQTVTFGLKTKHTEIVTVHGTTPFILVLIASLYVHLPQLTTSQYVKMTILSLIQPQNGHFYHPVTLLPAKNYTFIIPT